MFIAVQNYSGFGEDVVPLLLKEGARADIIDNVSMIHVNVVIHVYICH